MYTDDYVVFVVGCIFHTIQYSGLIILQTARAENGDHVKTLSNYINLTESLLEKYFGS
jgi:hypothetical protein